MDNKTRKPLPFGTLNIHKKNNFQDATICIFIFDILYLNGEVLLTQPIEKRRQLLIKYLTVIFFFFLLFKFILLFLINYFERLI